MPWESLYMCIHIKFHNFNNKYLTDLYWYFREWAVTLLWSSKILYWWDCKGRFCKVAWTRTVTKHTQKAEPLISCCFWFLSLTALKQSILWSWLWQLGTFVTDHCGSLVFGLIYWTLVQELNTNQWLPINFDYISYCPSITLSILLFKHFWGKVICFFYPICIYLVIWGTYSLS